MGGWTSTNINEIWCQNLQSIRVIWLRTSAANRCRLRDRPSPRRKWLMERSCMGVWSCILLRQANTSHFKRLFIPLPKAQSVSRSLKGQRGDCWCRKTPILQPRLPEHWQAVHHHEALSGQRGRRVDSRVQDELRRDQGMPGWKPQGFAEKNGWEK